MQQRLLEIVTRQFELQVVEQRSPVLDLDDPSTAFPALSRRLETRTDMIYPDSNEKTRSEMLIAPLLIGVAIHCNVSLYSGNDFTVNRILSGTVDYLFSKTTPQASTVQPPITAVVEAKSLHLDRGITHCLVQMVAAQQFNSQPNTVYGVVTTGTIWRFLKLQGKIVTIDLTKYSLSSPERIFSLLIAMVK